MTSTAIRPYRVDIPQTALDDLDGRLRRALWPSELPGVGGSYGVTNERVKNLAGRWLDGFDWRAVEARLNAHPQFVTEIDGENIHFLHVRSSRQDATPLVLTHGWPGATTPSLPAPPPRRDATPLVLTHGWPGSVVESLDVMGPLPEPESADEP